VKNKTRKRWSKDEGIKNGEVMKRGVGRWQGGGPLITKLNTSLGCSKASEVLERGFGKKIEKRRKEKRRPRNVVTKTAAKRKGGVGGGNGKRGRGVGTLLRSAGKKGGRQRPSLRKGRRNEVTMRRRNQLKKKKGVEGGLPMGCPVGGQKEKKGGWN